MAELNDPSKSERKRRSIFTRWRRHYRLVVMDDDNFEMKASVKLTKLNVLLFCSTALIVFGAILIAAIWFTPVKAYIPGYQYSDAMRHDLQRKLWELDSLHEIMQINDSYLRSRIQAFNGDVDTSLDPYRRLNGKDLDHYMMHDLVSDEVFLNQLVSNGKTARDRRTPAFFFPPLKGLVTETFDLASNHLGVDIVAPKGTPIHATLPGVVVFSGWTDEDGYVVAIQHNDNLLSIYKHNHEILTKVGNFVRSGDAVAIIGNSGELSEGPHLHFELWRNQTPVDPQIFIHFE